MTKISITVIKHKNGQQYTHMQHRLKGYLKNKVNVITSTPCGSSFVYTKGTETKLWSPRKVMVAIMNDRLHRDKGNVYN